MLNQIVLVGRVTKKPEMMENQDGSKFATLDLAIPRTFKNEKGEYDTDFIDCALWKGIAENTCNYVKKGDLVGVKGRLQKDSEDNELKIIAEKVTFLQSKKVEDD